MEWTYRLHLQRVSRWRRDVFLKPTATCQNTCHSNAGGYISMLWEWGFPRPCCWKFVFSRMRRHVDGSVFPKVSKNPGALTWQSQTILTQTVKVLRSFATHGNMRNTDPTTRRLIESRGTKLGAWDSSLLCYQPRCRRLIYVVLTLTHGSSVMAVGLCWHSIRSVPRNNIALRKCTDEKLYMHYSRYGWVSNPCIAGCEKMKPWVGRGVVCQNDTVCYIVFNIVIRFRF